MLTQVFKKFTGEMFSLAAHFYESLMIMAAELMNITIRYCRQIVSVFDNFEGLALKGLTLIFLTFFKPLASFHTP